MPRLSRDTLISASGRPRTHRPGATQSPSAETVPGTRGTPSLGRRVPGSPHCTPVGSDLPVPAAAAAAILRPTRGRASPPAPPGRRARDAHDIDRVDAYLDAHRGAFEEQLKALIRIPSVSAQPDHDADTRRAAEFVRDDLVAMGLAPS